MLCLQCQKETKNPKFCCTKCSAQFNNHKQPRLCKVCGTIISIGWVATKYCDECKRSYHPNFKDWSKITLQSMFDKLPVFQVHARIRGLARQIFKQSGRPRICQNCGYSKFIEVCHIKPIGNFDKTTAISIINDISNLVGLCPNCHYELDHDLLELNKIH